MAPETLVTEIFSALTSGSAFRIGSAISSTGLMAATDTAMPASAVKAPISSP